MVYKFPTITSPIAWRETIWPLKSIAASLSGLKGSKLYLSKYSSLTAEHCPGTSGLILVTSIGILVPGNTARFWTSPVSVSVRIKAKASE